MKNKMKLIILTVLLVLFIINPMQGMRPTKEQYRYLSETQRYFSESTEGKISDRLKSQVLSDTKQLFERYADVNPVINYGFVYTNDLLCIKEVVVIISGPESKHTIAKITLRD